MNTNQQETEIIYDGTGKLQPAKSGAKLAGKTISSYGGLFASPGDGGDGYPGRVQGTVDDVFLRKAEHIDPLRRSMSIDGKLVLLTVKQFDILHFLASYPGFVFSKEQIYERVWNDDYQSATTRVSDHISSLRKKLGPSPSDRRYIQTVYGAGYRFVEPK